MTVDIFDFWKKLEPRERIHPADLEVFRRVGRSGHGLDLRCLPSCFGGRLRTAPVVLLFLSPGFSLKDLRDANSSKGRTFYAERRTGRQPFPKNGPSKWLASRIKVFGVDYQEARSKLAVLNIGAYHSKNFTDYPLLAALPSSRVSLEWAQNVLFPQAIRGEKVVVCLRASHFWGLAEGSRHGLLFAPYVTRGGHMKKRTDKERKMRKAVVDAVQRKLQPPS